VRVGETTVDAVYDGTAYYPVQEAPPGEGLVPPSGDWASHLEFLTGDGRLRLDMGAFVVRTPTSTVLVDAGAGPDHPRFASTRLLASLAELGVTADTVTDVVFTHLHSDHIGWSTLDGRAVFPRATYRCHRADWDHFVPADEPVSTKLAPVAGQVVTWDADATVLPGIDVVGAPGHTPGSSVVVISSGSERVVLLGDVVHCPAELLEDEWLVVADVDPALAQRTREALAREIETTGAVAAAAHFPELAFGRLLPGQGRRQWVIS
jgi:glyoxylase-like metal-dependent hydrolase (beta-lactamase superfamily II)